MDSYTIDVELEHYCGERMAMNSREACRRFYWRAAARFDGVELEKYLRRVRAQATAYASLSRMLRSPYRHMEAPLFLSGLVLVIAGIVTIACGGQSLVVAGGTSAGLVGMIECAAKLRKQCRRHAEREAVFRELAQELKGSASTP